jgi:hypothetical protein
MNINPMDFLKNFQNIQSKMTETQEKLGQVTVTGTSGGDLVRVQINGHFSVLSVEISPEVIDPQDKEMLQDLVLAAFTDAMAKAKEAIREEMSSLTGGMPLPPNMMGM